MACLENLLTQVGSIDVTGIVKIEILKFNVCLKNWMSQVF